MASSKAHQDVTELLLSHGVDVTEVTTKRSWSALVFFVLNGHAHFVITPLKHGLFAIDNFKTMSCYNRTPIQYAAPHNAKNVVLLLIQSLKDQRKGAPKQFPCSTGNSSGKPCGEMETPENNTGTVHTLSVTYDANAQVTLHIQLYEWPMAIQATIHQPVLI